ncbi:MAG: hypothetical protein WD875_19145 [Pirellulales bacterium]
MEHIADFAAVVMLVVFVSIGCALIVFLRRNWRRELLAADDALNENNVEEVAPLPPLDATPDRPQFFGYKTSWIAVRSGNAEDIVRVFVDAEVFRANWASGNEAARQGLEFVTPVVDGWVFIIAPWGTIATGDDPFVFAEELSRQFGESQYFHTHRIVDAHAWYLFRNGQELRGYEYLGESGSTDRNHGERTPGEIALGYQYFDESSPEASSEEYWERDDLTSPSEDHVMEVAGKWSIDPRTLDEREEVSCGWVIRRSTLGYEKEWDV